MLNNFTLGKTLSLPGRYNVQGFGATPTEEQSGFDSTAAFNAALSMAIRDGYELYVPAGTYRITSSLTITDAKSVRIRGSGAKTVIQSSSSTFEALIIGKNNASGPSGYLRDLSITSLSAPRAANNKAGVKIDQLKMFEVSNVSVNNYDYGFDLVNGCDGTSFHKCHTGTGVNIGVILRATSQSGTDIVFHDMNLYGEIAAVNVFPSGGDYVFYGGTLNSNNNSGTSIVDTKATVLIGRDTSGTIGDCGRIVLSGVDLKGMRYTNAIRSFGAVQLVVASCSFNPNVSPSATVLKMTGAGASRVDMRGNSVKGLWSAASLLSIADDTNDFSFSEIGTVYDATIAGTPSIGSSLLIQSKLTKGNSLAKVGTNHVVQIGSILLRGNAGTLQTSSDWGTNWTSIGSGGGTIPDGSITGAKLVDGAVIDAKIADKTISGGKLKDDTIGYDKLTVEAMGVANVKKFGAKGDGTTDDRASIQAAIAYLGAKGGILYFPTGTYRVTNSVNIRSSDGIGPVSVRGDGDASVILIDHPTHTAAPLYISGMSGVSYRDFKVKGTVTLIPANRNSSQHGIWILDSTDVTIHNIAGEGVAAAFIVTQRCSNMLINGCRYKNTLADGIHITDKSKNITITNNKGFNTGDDGIAVVSYVADGGYCENIVIAHNIVRQSLSRGVGVIGGKRITVDSNIIENTVSSGILTNKDTNYNTYEAVDAVITNNTIIDAGQGTPKAGVPTGNQFGIELAGGSAGTICEGNVVRNAKTRGICAFGATGASSDYLIVRRNKVIQSGRVGYHITGLKGCIIESNRSESNGEYGGWFQSLTRTSISRNVFYNNNTSQAASIDNANISSCTDCTITCNVAEDDNAVKLVERGIEINSATNCKIGGNTVIQSNGVKDVQIFNSSGIENVGKVLVGNTTPTDTFYVVGTPYFNYANSSTYIWNGTTWNTSSGGSGGTVSLPFYDVKKDFGAIGDGIVDDTVAIQAAINAIVPKGRRLFFPAGTYRISSAISIPQGVGFILDGDSKDSTIIKQYGTNVPIFQFTKAGTSYWQIRNFGFLYNTNPTSSHTKSCPILFEQTGTVGSDGFWNFVIEWCTFQNGYIGIASSDSQQAAMWGVTVRNIDYYGTMTKGFIRFRPNPDVGQPNIKLENVYAWCGDTVIGPLIDIIDADTVYLSCVEFNHVRCVPISINSCSNVTLINTRCEENVFTVGAGQKIRFWDFINSRVNIIGCEITNSTISGSGDFHMISGDIGGELSITGFQLWDTKINDTAKVYLMDADTVNFITQVDISGGSGTTTKLTTRTVPKLDTDNLPSGGGGSTTYAEVLSSLPTANSTNRGRVVCLTSSGMDEIYMCKKLSNGTYDWKQIG